MEFQLISFFVFFSVGLWILLSLIHYLFPRCFYKESVVSKLTTSASAMVFGDPFLNPSCYKEGRAWVAYFMMALSFMVLSIVILFGNR